MAYSTIAKVIDDRYVIREDRDRLGPNPRKLRTSD